MMKELASPTVPFAVPSFHSQRNTGREHQSSTGSLPGGPRISSFSGASCRPETSRPYGTELPGIPLGTFFRPFSLGSI